MNFRPGLAGIVANSGWLLADKAVRMALGVFVGAWVARYLGPSSFGELSYAIAYIALFQTIATLGIDGLVVRDLARDSGAAGDILGTAIVLRLASGALCALGGLVALLFVKGTHDPYVVLSAIAACNLIFQAVDVIDLWFQSKVQSRRTVLAKLSACVASNALKVVLVVLRAPLYAFAIVLVFEVAAGAGALAIVYRKFPTPHVWGYSRRQASRLLLESWPFVIAGAVNMLQARIEFVMIESFLGAAALGQYAAAARFIEIFDVIFASLVISIFPRLSMQASSDSDSAMKKAYLLAFLTYIAITPLLLAVWWIIGMIYGPSYEPARQLFPFMALRPLLAYLGLTKSMAIRLNFRSHYALFSSTVGAVFAAGTAYLLLPVFGLYGAVFASLFSYLLSNVLIDALFYRSNFKNMFFCWQEWRYFARIMAPG